MIILKENVLDIDTYLSLRKSVQWKELTREQANMALNNSLITICAYHQGNPVGMGRLVGDGAVICYVQDLVILPSAQGLGVGKQILNHLKNYVSSIQLEATEMMLALMCAKGREEFYKASGFIERPNHNLGPGMIQYLKKNGEVLEDL